MLGHLVTQIGLSQNLAPTLYNLKLDKSLSLQNPQYRHRV